MIHIWLWGTVFSQLPSTMISLVDHPLGWFSFSNSHKWFILIHFILYEVIIVLPLWFVSSTHVWWIEGLFPAAPIIRASQYILCINVFTHYHTLSRVPPQTATHGHTYCRIPARALPHTTTLLYTAALPYTHYCNAARCNMLPHTATSAWQPHIAVRAAIHYK